MEVINKTIKQITKFEEISENEIIVIPDTNVIYSVKLLLTKRDNDLGYFDGIDEVYGNENYGYGQTSIAIGSALL